MRPDQVSNPGPLTYESGALPTALRGPAEDLTIRYLDYRISPVIRQFFSFQNNPKNLQPSYKTDLDLWNCLGRVKLVL